MERCRHERLVPIYSQGLANPVQPLYLVFNDYNYATKADTGTENVVASCLDCAKLIYDQRFEVGTTMNGNGYQFACIEHPSEDN